MSHYVDTRLLYTYDVRYTWPASNVIAHYPAAVTAFN